MPSTDFYRLKRLPDYVFETTNRIKAEARAAGKDIIDLGMGNPDIPVPEHIVEKLIESIKKPGTHRYSVSRGIHGLRKAKAGYYKRRYDVDLCPDKEIIATLGSKEGLANLAQAITAPGDIVLTPNPSYPIHPFGFIIAGASIRHIPSPSPEDFLEALPGARAIQLASLGQVARHAFERGQHHDEDKGDPLPAVCHHDENARCPGVCRPSEIS